MTADVRVWAPEAAHVDIVLAHPEERREPMTPTRDGCWVWQGAPLAGYPLDYAFSLDGADPLPDPRSAWQPHGVDGPSRWFDPSEHGWRDGEWRGPRQGAGTLGSVMYELHVGTFTPEGTFDAATERLGELVDLGVEVIEVMPVAAFPGRWGWGYDGVFLGAVHDQYGGPAAFQRFVDACHTRGIGVCLDVVYNHLGPMGNHLSAFGPYFTQAHHTPWGPAVNLDQAGSEHVRAWIVGNALRWLRDFHVDALRLDAVHELRDDSPRHLLAELSDEVAVLEREVDRPLTLIAESDLNDTVMVTPTSAGGRGMDGQWADDVHHALHVSLTGEDQGYYGDFAGRCPAWPEGGAISVLAKTLQEVFLHDGRWSSFRDEDWGRPVERQHIGGRRFVAYLQNHDQVGNRALGDRIGATTGPGRQAAGAALYLLSAFTPMIFMGEEWAASSPFQFFTDFPDPDLGEAVRSGRRAEFASHGWEAQDVPDPQDPATRERSVLVWSEREEEGHARMLAWYRVLTTLRRREAGLLHDDLCAVGVRLDEDAGWITVSRGGIRVVVNLADTPRTVPVRSVHEVVASWSGQAATGPDGVRLEPDDVAVLRA